MASEGTSVDVATEKPKVEKRRIPCPTCKRRFIEESLNNHILKCKEHERKQSERVSFDSIKQRMSDFSPLSLLTIKSQPPRLYNVKWRDEHSIWMSNKNGLVKKKVKGHAAASQAKPDSKGGTLCLGCDQMIYDENAENHIVFCVEKNKRK